jgi:hypothetical protein
VPASVNKLPATAHLEQANVKMNDRKLLLLVQNHELLHNMSDKC